MLKSQSVRVELPSIHLGFLIVRVARFEVEDSVGTVIERGNDIEAAAYITGALAARKLNGLGAHLLFAIGDNARRRAGTNGFGSFTRIVLFLESSDPAKDGRERYRWLGNTVLYL
jgi:hypothetical protein